MRLPLGLPLAVALLGLTQGLLVGCASNPDAGFSGFELKDPRSADPFDVVDCLLPGQIRQLGSQVTYVTARRPIRTTAEDCAIRGGEYVALDRADYGTALKVWMSAAQGGDPDAQYYAGVLYEKGAEGQPNYAQAASWYRQSADRGVSRAAINLGRLYEQGLGVRKSAEDAYMWYAKASGLREAGLAQLMGQGDKPIGKPAGPPGGPQPQIEGLQQALEAIRTQLTERTSLLQEERRKLEQLKSGVGTAGGGQSASTKEMGGGSTTKGTGADRNDQAKMVVEREREVGQLQNRVATIKNEIKQQIAKMQQGGTQDHVVPGPSIQIVDPPVVITRGIRVEEGRIPVILRKEPDVRLTGRVNAPAGLRSLFANGKPMSVDEQGLFTVFPGERTPGQRGIPVDIVAEDTQGKHGNIRLFLTDASAGSTAKDSVEANTGLGRYHALVVGNDRYRQWVPLNTAGADADSVAEVLKDRYGFRVTLLKDTTRKEILKSLNEYRKTLTERDYLLIYYAGHGYLEPQIDRGYWIPIDGDLMDNTDWVEFPALTDLLQLISAQQVLVVADSCFAGKLSRSTIGQLAADLPDQTRTALLQEMAKRKIRTALTSGGARPVLDDGGEGHSLFAKAFIKILSENTAPLETERLFWAVRARVMQTAERMKFEQVPTYAPIHMAGHEGFGDFVFVPTMGK
jgi:hypothetical protein